MCSRLVRSSRLLFPQLPNSVEHDSPQPSSAQPSVASQTASVAQPSEQQSSEAQGILPKRFIPAVADCPASISVTNKHRLRLTIPELPFKIGLTTRVNVQSKKETSSNHNSTILNSSTLACASECAGDVHILDFSLDLQSFRSVKTGGHKLTKMRQKRPELREPIRASRPQAAILLQFATSHTGGYNSPPCEIIARSSMFPTRPESTAGLQKY